MILRKINAVLSLFTTILLMVHAISIAFWMLSRGQIIPLGGHTLPNVLIGFFAAHALMSIIVLATSHKAEKNNNVMSHSKLNVQTIVQRISGVLLIVFTFLHIAGAKGIITPPAFIHAVVPTVFYTVTMVHIAVSGSKPFITLGIGNAKFIKGADIAIKAICAITLIADIIGFYLHVC